MDSLLIELYTLIKVRQSVFIVEQDCPYNDLDNKDQKAFHLMGYQNKKLVSYSRIFPPGVLSYEVVIGRILVVKEFRAKGLGVSLMNKALKVIKSNFGDVTIRLEAQTYLNDFYVKFGFKSVGKEYLEDDIPHISMIRD